jgi:hypothetical protein
MDSASYAVLAVWYDNPIPARFQTLNIVIKFQHWWAVTASLFLLGYQPPLIVLKFQH